MDNFLILNITTNCVKTAKFKGCWHQSKFITPFQCPYLKYILILYSCLSSSHQSSCFRRSSCIKLCTLSDTSHQLISVDWFIQQFLINYTGFIPSSARNYQRERLVHKWSRQILYYYPSVRLKWLWELRKSCVRKAGPLDEFRTPAIHSTTTSSRTRGLRGPGPGPGGPDGVRVQAWFKR
jgi:hypothetical protein